MDKKIRGGANRGQGRHPTVPHLKRVRIPIRLPQWLADKLKKHGNQGKTVEETLVEKHGWKQPKP